MERHCFKETIEIWNFSVRFPCVFNKSSGALLKRSYFLVFVFLSICMYELFGEIKTGNIEDSTSSGHVCRNM